MPSSTVKPLDRRQQKKPTLNDIALQLGISRATVSNAFNHPEVLSAATREKILSLSQEMGYFGPDPRARAMRRPELHEVAVIFHHDLRYALGDPLSVDFLRGVGKELDRRQLSLHLIPRMGRRVMLSAAFQTSADALIVHAEISEDLMPQLRAMRKPMVLVDTFTPDFPSVSIDDKQGACIAMEHALAKSPDHIVVICLPVGPAEHARVMASPHKFESRIVGGVRMSGYLQALIRARFPLTRVTWLEVDDNDPEMAAAVALPVLESLLGQQRVAVVSMSDRMALAVLKSLREAALPPPVSLIGFDDIPGAAAAGLTTIRQDAQRKGEVAVCVALDGIASVRLPVQAVVRST